MTQIIINDSLENFSVKIVDGLLDLIEHSYGDLGLTEELKIDLDKNVVDVIKRESEKVIEKN